MRSNEQARFLARKSLAQTKRISLINSGAKSKRWIQNQNSIRTINPQHNVPLPMSQKQNTPIPSIKIPPPDHTTQHFSGILHLYLRSSLANKHCQKRHIPEPQHPKTVATERRHNYDVPVSKEQHQSSIVRSRSTMRSKIDKDLKSELSMSEFAREKNERPPSRRKHLEMLEINTNRGDELVRRISERKVRELEGNGLQSETKRMIKKREDFLRSSFKLG